MDWIQSFMINVNAFFKMNSTTKLTDPQLGIGANHTSNTTTFRFGKSVESRSAIPPIFHTSHTVNLELFK